MYLQWLTDNTCNFSCTLWISRTSVVATQNVTARVFSLWKINCSLTHTETAFCTFDILRKIQIQKLCVCACGRVCSIHFLLGVQWSSVWREGWGDSLPTVWWPYDVRRPTVKQPHRHLGKKQLSIRTESERESLFSGILITDVLRWPCHGNLWVSLTESAVAEQ